MGTHELSNCPRSTLRDRASRLLGVRPEIGIQPPSVTHGRTWNRGAVDGVELSWGTPRTQAWLLRPAGHTGPDLPAVLLLHGPHVAYASGHVGPAVDTTHAVHQRSVATIGQE